MKVRLVHIIPIEIPIILFPNSHLFPSLFPNFSSLNIHILKIDDIIMQIREHHTQHLHKRLT